MTPQQQPQQELMEIIEKLGGVLKTAQIENTPDWMDYVFMEVIPEAEKKLAAIRSRPNTPSPGAPNENQIRAKEIREEVHKVRQEQRDAAIRNEVLDELDKLALQEAKTRSIKQGGLAFVTVQVWIESLRTKERDPK